MWWKNNNADRKVENFFKLQIYRHHLLLMMCLESFNQLAVRMHFLLSEPNLSSLIPPPSHPAAKYWRVYKYIVLTSMKFLDRCELDKWHLRLATSAFLKKSYGWLTIKRKSLKHFYVVASHVSDRIYALEVEMRLETNWGTHFSLT